MRHGRRPRSLNNNLGRQLSALRTLLADPVQAFDDDDQSIHAAVAVRLHGREHLPDCRYKPGYRPASSSWTSATSRLQCHAEVLDVPHGAPDAKSPLTRASSSALKPSGAGKDQTKDSLRARGQPPRLPRQFCCSGRCRRAHADRSSDPEDGLVAAIGEGERAIASANAAARVNSVAAGAAWEGKSSCNL